MPSSSKAVIAAHIRSCVNGSSLACQSHQGTSGGNCPANRWQWYSMWALVRSGSPHGHHNDSGGSAGLKWVAYELMKAWSTVAWKAVEVPEGVVVPVWWFGEREFVRKASGPAPCSDIPLPLLPLCSPLLVGLLPRAVLLEGHQLYVFDPSWGGASACLGCFELFVSWGPYQHNTGVSRLPLTNIPVPAEIGA
ncbi:hypothetical protein EDB85DRAFT_1895401 [Lactarius pseudohatsudake]|nr:hypothetical protein EDB85DRAFT_1895401 [Lactarius pseudohatsudake]